MWKPPQKLAMALVLALAAAPGAADLGVAAGSDCSRARDPQRCAARLAARAVCRDKSGLEKRRCQALLLPEPDCSKAAAPARCAAQAAARAACRGEEGAAFRRCMRARLPGWRAWDSQLFR